MHPQATGGQEGEGGTLTSLTLVMLKSCQETETTFPKLK